MNLGLSDIDLTDVVRDIVYDTLHNDYVDYYDTVFIEDRCKALKDKPFVYCEEAPKNGPDAIEYCSIKSMTGECVTLDTAGNLREYCDERYGRVRLDISRIVPESKPVIYQGVCPDGWRLPNKNDWAILQENIHDRGASLRDDNSSGFGYTDVMTVSLVDAETPWLLVENRVYLSAAKIVAVPERVDGSYSNFFNWLGYRKHQLMANETITSSSDEPIPWYEYGDVEFRFYNEDAPVRCIKN
jgi:uncharacterized protein (TIGR02145 family)